jgi:cytochrome b involved in lipid metabolism
VLNFFLFFGSILLLEIRHQRRLRTHIPLSIESHSEMSLEEFNQRCACGAQLILLDNLVLKVDEFASAHPGGKFLIQHNVGRDISKFFFGGYSLENYPSAKGHNHSNFARMIANDLAIAKLQ